MQELLFLGGFIVFIVAILLVDMLAIDRKAHVVSIKEAGIWTGVWIILALGFSVFLWFHGDMVHGIHDFNDLRTKRIQIFAPVTDSPVCRQGPIQCEEFLFQLPLIIVPPVQMKQCLLR